MRGLRGSTKMKMVIVFDTEDDQGMKNTLKIVDQLARDYFGRGMDDSYKRNFGKIEFIKMLRTFAQKVKIEVEDDDVTRDGSSLRFSKDFAEEVWRRKEDGNRYQ